jgi:hypothetical protein
MSYFEQAQRVLAPGGKMQVVEPLKSFTGRGLHLLRIGAAGMGLIMTKRTHIQSKSGLQLIALEFEKGTPVGEPPTADLFDRHAL